MRIASFNVENLFSRAKAMNLGTWAEGKGILESYSKLNVLIQKPLYTNSDKQAMLDLLAKLGLLKDDDGSFVILRQNRGDFIKRPPNAPPQIVANGRGNWIGWIELKTEAVNQVATQMTAKVIQDVKADILAVIEAENRISLCHFNDQLLNPIGTAYDQIMLIDGNDERGIDVGLLTKSGYTIEAMVSHVDDRLNGERLFSRDCPEFTIRKNATTSLLILVNHFKSKGFGPTIKSNEKRKAQAARVREIYDLRRNQGISLIAVVGDFNDTPDSNPLTALLSNGSDLRDISTHPQFQSDGRDGTFGNGNKSEKIDYILLSPELFALVSAGGVWRKGVWGGTKGTLFPHYPEITKSEEAASDHAAIWADINL